jgi:hypothetical protein
MKDFNYNSRMIIASRRDTILSAMILLMSLYLVIDYNYCFQRLKQYGIKFACSALNMRSLMMKCRNNIYRNHTVTHYQFGFTIMAIFISCLFYLALPHLAQNKEKE